VSLSGFGLRVSVDKGHLILADGVGNKRREGRFSRAMGGIRRLIVRGNAGFITFDALHWLFDIGAAFIQIGYDGEVIAATGPQGLNDARLRRAQALAPWNETGLTIMRDILRDKLRGQAGALERITDSAGAIATVRGAIVQLEYADSLEGMRSIEARAANAYWGAWENVPITFVRRDEKRVPDHWRTFGARMSPLSAKPRYAINPPNAILNYLYATLGAEAAIAAKAVGLDPGMGILHVDVQSRDSLAFDLMEPVRPQVDAFLLDLLKGQPLSAAMFFENNKGVCRVLPPLAHTLAETASAWRRAVAPVVEQVARVLHSAGRSFASPAGRPAIPATGARERRTSERKLPTRLTQVNKLSTLAAKRAQPERQAPSQRAVLPNACRTCGAILEGPKSRRYCDDCLPERRHEVAAAMGSRVPTYAERWRLRPEDAPDPERFKREILPLLQDVILRNVAQAIGGSLTQAAKVRRGALIPHPRHWQALADLCTNNTEPANPLRRGSGRKPVGRVQSTTG
jgi:CRISPR-associated endonuclease Cas1